MHRNSTSTEARNMIILSSVLAWIYWHYMNSLTVHRCERKQIITEICKWYTYMCRCVITRWLQLIYMYCWSSWHYIWRMAQKAYEKCITLLLVHKSSVVLPSLQYVNYLVYFPSLLLSLSQRVQMALGYVNFSRKPITDKRAYCT